MSTLAFFIPDTNTRNRDNEFGPGFYTTDSFKYALEYLRGGGAVMVFKGPDLHSSRLCQPTPQEWNAWVARWLRKELTATDPRVPLQYFTADFIQGPITERGTNAVPRTVPRPGVHQQLVAVSYKGCEVLSKCLEMILFVE